MPGERGMKFWSGVRELNPFHRLGKAGHDRYTNPARLRSVAKGVLALKGWSGPSCSYDEVCSLNLRLADWPRWLAWMSSAVALRSRSWRTR